LFVCRTLQIPDDKRWLGVFNKAILTLTQPGNWEHNTPEYLTPEEAAAECYAIFEQYLAGEMCNAPAPYWDTPDSADDDAAPNTYGQLDDLTFVENIGIWGITAFIAYAGDVGAALQFATFAPRFVLAWKKSGVGGAIRVFIDGVDHGLIDTNDPTGGIVEQAYTPSPASSHTIVQVLESVPLSATAFTPGDPSTAAMQVIRKRLTEVEVDVVTDIRQSAASGQLEMLRGGVWIPVPTANNVRVGGTVRMTGGLTIDRPAAAGDTAVNNPITSIKRVLAAPPDGVGLAWRMQTETTPGGTIRALLRIESRMETVNDATRRSMFEMVLADWVAQRVIIRGNTTGAAGAVGFLGANAVIRQVITGERQQNAALASLLTALVNFGLITDSTTAGTLPVGPAGPAGPAGPPGEPGTPAETPLGDLPQETSIELGACVSYDLILGGNQQLLLPVVLQEGYTITLSALTGAASDGGTLDLDEPLEEIFNWFCPNGQQYVLGGCTGGGFTDAGDPEPTLNHMTLLMSINGAIFDAGAGGMFTVPAGVSGQMAMFQVNDSVLVDNQGEYRFHVEVCNPDMDMPMMISPDPSYGSLTYLGDNRWLATSKPTTGGHRIGLQRADSFGECGPCWNYTDIEFTGAALSHSDHRRCGDCVTFAPMPAEATNINSLFMFSDTGSFTFEFTANPSV